MEAVPAVHTLQRMAAVGLVAEATQQHMEAVAARAAATLQHTEVAVAMRPATEVVAWLLRLAVAVGVLAF